LRYLHRSMRRLGVAVGLVLVGVAVALFFLYSQTDVERQLRRGEWVRVMVVGVDSGAQEEPQADYIAVFGISPKGAGTVLTVPSDLALPLEGAEGEVDWVRLADLRALEGTEGIARRLTELLEVQLDYTVEVDFEVFRQVVDAVGGVTVEVASRLAYADISAGLFIDIRPGTQTLDGEEALHFVRYKAAAIDVEGRARRAQQFLLALWDRLRELSWSRWRELARVVRETNTDLSFWEALDLARALRELHPDDVRFRVLPYAITRGQVRPDIVRVRQLTRVLYADEVWMTRSQVRIQVLNGTGEDLVASAAAADLEDLGFRIAGKDRATRTDFDRSVLLYRTGYEEHAESVARFLPPDTSIVSIEEWGEELPGEFPEDASLLMVVGRGFQVGG